MVNAVIATRAGVLTANIYSLRFKNRTPAPSSCILHLLLISKVGNPLLLLISRLHSFPHHVTSRSPHCDLRNEMDSSSYCFERTVGVLFIWSDRRVALLANNCRGLFI